MKKIYCLLLAAAFLLPGVVSGAHRLAAVNLEKVFNEYYKSKIADDVIKQQWEVFQAYRLKLRDEMRKLESEYAVARDGSLNLALSDTSRKEYESTARRKAEEIAAKRAELEKYETEKTAQMRELELQKRQEILLDIRNEVKRRAVAEGYDFVLDSSGRTTNDVAAVLYANPALDLTDVVLQTLNAAATAPAEKK